MMVLPEFAGSVTYFEQIIHALPIKCGGDMKNLFGFSWTLILVKLKSNGKVAFS